MRLNPTTCLTCYLQMGSGVHGDAHGVRVGVQADDQSGKVRLAQIAVRRTTVAGQHRHLEESQIRDLGHDDPSRPVRIFCALRPFGLDHF